MTKYCRFEVVEAKKMTADEYAERCKARGKNYYYSGDDRRGYFVKLEDSCFFEWMPKDVFEKKYEIFSGGKYDR